MKALVTGASGFIGSNLVERLLNEGYHVVGIDKDRKKKYLLEDAIGKKIDDADVTQPLNNIEMIWDDINKLETYHYLLDDVNEVYHLAASANIRKSYKKPKMDLHNNVNGTSEVLEVMRKKGISKLIFASSSSVYGETDVTPTPEDVGAIKPISLYGASKFANEAFINAYTHLYGIDGCMFRFANVVGKHQHRGVIYDFYKKLQKSSRKLHILGNGEQEKSFFDVSDCVEALISIPNHNRNGISEVYNLGNTETMKVKELARIVGDELGYAPKLDYEGGDRGWAGDTPYTILDISKALKTGWEPKYSCEEAIRRTVQWLIDNEI